MYLEINMQIKVVYKHLNYSYQLFNHVITLYSNLIQIY